MERWTLPEGWEWKRLEALVEMKTGFACAKKHLVTDRQGRPHLRPFNIGIDGEIDLTEIYYIPEDVITDWESYTLEPGHILFNNTNSVELVGKTALVKTRLTGAFSNHITRLIVRDPAEVDPAWLTLTLRWFWQTGYFTARCNRWIGQAGFNTSMLAEMQVPIPPLAEQRRIVARLEALLDEVREMRALLKAMQKDTDQLEQSILAAAFRGEV